MLDQNLRRSCLILFTMVSPMVYSEAIRQAALNLIEAAVRGAQAR